MLEDVQRRVTKILPELYTMSYEERLEELKLTTLHYRRKRMDMIQTFKIINNMDSLPVNELFEFSETSTRGHTKKLKKPRCIKSFRSNSFCARVIDPWNNLPQTIITAVIPTLR